MLTALTYFKQASLKLALTYNLDTGNMAIGPEDRARDKKKDVAIVRPAPKPAVAPGAAPTPIPFPRLLRPGMSAMALKRPALAGRLAAS